MDHCLTQNRSIRLPMIRSIFAPKTKVCLLKRYIEVPDGALLLWQIFVKIFHRDDQIVIFKQQIAKFGIKITIRRKFCLNWIVTTSTTYVYWVKMSNLNNFSKCDKILLTFSSTLAMFWQKFVTIGTFKTIITKPFYISFKQIYFNYCVEKALLFWKTHLSWNVRQPSLEQSNLLFLSDFISKQTSALINR